MNIPVINLSKHALPKYETVASAGLDLRANIEEVIHLEPLQRVLVPTGLLIELPVGYEAQIRPRSGLSLKTFLRVSNSPGTVDRNYRGEVGVILTNSAPYSPADYLYDEYKIRINKGDRIAQGVICPVAYAEFELSDRLSDTSRGAGGFGSTGD